MVAAESAYHRVPVDHRVQGSAGGGLEVGAPPLEATGMSAAYSTVARLVAITWPLVATRLNRNLLVKARLTDLAAVSVVPVGGLRCRPV